MKRPKAVWDHIASRDAVRRAAEIQIRVARRNHVNARGTADKCLTSATTPAEGFGMGLGAYHEDLRGIKVRGGVLTRFF